MALRLRLNSQRSSSVFLSSWQRGTGPSWLPSRSGLTKSQPHAEARRGLSAAELQTRFPCSCSHDNLNREELVANKKTPALESRAIRSLPRFKFTYSNSSGPWLFPSQRCHGAGSKENFSQRAHHCHLLAERKSFCSHEGYRHYNAVNRFFISGDRAFPGLISHRKFLSSSHREHEHQAESVGSTTSIEQKPAEETDEAGRRADELENDPFLQEFRALQNDESGETEPGEGVELEEAGGDDIRLEKAERDYLEALGRGEATELDLEQLESLLGHAPPGDATVGSLYLKLGQEYDANGEGAEQVLRCGEKALAIFQTKTEDVRLEVAMALHLIGTAYMRQEKYETSLPVLYESLELFESKGGEQSRAAKCAVQFLLGEALSNWGKADEALKYLRSAVSEQELILGKEHVQLGKGYRKLAEVLASVMKHEEALPFAQKAVDIHTKNYGESSMDEAIDRRLLAVIYVGLEEHEKALAEHVIVRQILAASGHGSSQTVFVDISTADTQITLGKYNEAISSLEAALSKVDKGTAMHALALVNLAKVYERKKKPELVDKYAKEVLKILESQVLTSNEPLAVAEGFTELAALYERIDQTASAIEMLKKAHAIYEPIPHQRNAAAGTQAQIGMLLFFTGKVEEAVPFLQEAVKNLEGAVGEQNFALAMVLNHLGVANVELERLEAATEHFERAKAIFDEVLGSDHDDTIAVTRNLVNTYSLLDRLDDAIRCQTEVVSELKLKDTTEAKEMLEDAIGHLHMLQEHRDSGKLISETLGSDPRQFGRIISD